MPCSPGFFPVITELQDTDEISGMVDFIGVKTPSPFSSAKFGIIPFSARLFNRWKGTPSIPITTVLFFGGIKPIYITNAIKNSKYRKSQI